MQRNRFSVLFRENTFLYIIIIGLGILLAVQVFQNRIALQGYSSSSLAVQESAIGKQLPSLTLQTLKGNSVGLSESQQDYTLLIFLHTECDFCKLDMPLWRTIYERGEENNIRVLGVTAETDRDKILDYVEENKISFPVLLDPDSELFAASTVDYTPTKILLSRDGEILQVWRGWTTQSSHESSLGALRMVFNVHPQEVPQRQD